MREVKNHMLQSNSLEENGHLGRKPRRAVEKWETKSEENFQGEKGSSVHPGYAIPFDNVDIRIERRQMTKTSQNMDCHWVNHLYV